MVLPSPKAWHSTSSSTDRKSTRLNSSHSQISYAVFCLKKKNLPTSTCDGFGLCQTPRNQINAKSQRLLHESALIVVAFSANQERLITDACTVLRSAHVR